LIALGADVYVDLAFSPFDPRDGLRFRPKKIERDQM
jgi:hypothetical protein